MVNKSNANKYKEFRIRSLAKNKFVRSNTLVV